MLFYKESNFVEVHGVDAARYDAADFRFLTLF